MYIITERSLETNAKDKKAFPFPIKYQMIVIGHVQVNGHAS